MTMPATTQIDAKVLAMRTAVVCAVAALIILAVALLLFAGRILLLVFAGLLLATLLDTIAEAISHAVHISRGVALALTVVLLIGAVGIGGYFAWPSLSDQANELSRQLPEAFDKMQGWLKQFQWGQWVVGKADAEKLVSQGKVVRQATGVVMSTAGVFAAAFVVFFVAVYVAAQPEYYGRGLCRLFPVAARPKVSSVLEETVSVLRWWIVGKLMSMAIVGILTFLGLWLLNIPLAFIFALIACALTFIPNFGPVLSVIPPSVIALAQDPTKAGYVVLLYLAIQTIESYAITPLIQRRTVSMPPALTITAQIVLGLLAGGIGVAVATPLTAASLTMVRRLYVEGILERNSG